jgi:hypothetical protein
LADHDSPRSGPDAAGTADLGQQGGSASFTRVGRIDEWHVDFSKSLDHSEFDLFSRLRQAVVVLGPSFRHARLEAVGSVRDAVLGNRLKQLLIERLSVLNTAVGLVSNHGLESLEDLNRRLETDGSRLDANLTGRLI